MCSSFARVGDFFLFFFFNCVYLAARAPLPTYGYTVLRRVCEITFAI